jgi:chemotaxis protein methyltransferase CheR
MNNSSAKRLSEILAIEIRERYGVDSGEAVRAKIEELILSDTSSSTFDQYVELSKTKNHNALWQKIIEKITIHESYFQRNENILNAVAKTVDEILSEKKTLRIWSVPCATGEEAYDLAFIVAECVYYQNYGTKKLNDKLLEDLSLDHIYIYGTDISETSLKYAKLGQYNDLAMGALRKLDPVRRRYFFNQTPDYYEVKPKIKRMVKFVVTNVIDPPLQSNFDIILCRNMLIYFSDEQKKKCQENLAKALVPGGRLFLGSVDPFLLNPDDFTQHTDDQSIWYQKK